MPTKPNADKPKTYGKDNKPTASEWGQKRAYLARLGVPEAQVVLLIGRNPNEYKRLQMAQNTIEYCARLRKV